MSEEDTTQFTVQAAPEETRRQPTENTEKYGDRNPCSVRYHG